MNRIGLNPSISRAVGRALFVIAIAAVRGTPLHAQSDGTLELPFASLREITADFDAGRNALYCYHGHVDASSSGLTPAVHVDSVSSITTPSACRGLGFAFISRIDDHTFLLNALRGLIETSPEFSVVSAFYRTEVVDADGAPMRSARALSVVRGAPRMSVSHGNRSGEDD